MPTEINNHTVIKTDIATAWLRPDSIIWLEPVSENDKPYGLEEMKVFIDSIIELGNGQPSLAIVDVRTYKGMRSDRETRAYGAGKEGARAFKAMAFLVSSPVGRMIGNFFLRVNGPVYPAKLFASEEDAVAWLETFRD